MVLGSDQSWREADKVLHRETESVDTTETHEESDKRESPSKTSRKDDREKQPCGSKRPVETEPSMDVEAAFNRGWAKLREGDFNEAADAFEQVMSTNNETSLKEDAAYWLSITHLRAGNESLAEKAMKRFLSEYPGGRRAAEISAELGWLEVDAGRYDHARRRFVFALDAGSPKCQCAKEGLDAIEEKPE
jgi:TolA-binding protein